MNSREILKQWMAAINSHDVNEMMALTAADFVLVDSLGNRLNGASKLEHAWQGYFAMCPDYWVRGDCVMDDRGTILISGEAGGTIDGEPWRTPAAWKVIIRNRSVVEWRVFADNKPIYEILAKRQSVTRSR